MGSEEFNEAFKKYSDEGSKDTISETAKTREEIEKEYHREQVDPKLYEQFRNYFEKIFSHDGYFVDVDRKSCRVIIYGEYTLGIDIIMHLHRFPNYENRNQLDDFDFLSDAKFHVSEPWQVLRFNKKSKDPDKIAEKINKLYADLVNDHRCRYSGSRLEAMNGFYTIKTIDHSKGTLVVEGKEKLDFFLGGFAAISNPILAGSESYLSQFTRKEKIAIFQRWVVLILVILTGCLWIF